MKTMCNWAIRVAEMCERLLDLMLEDLLRDNPNSFGFFQAVRMLERLHPKRDRVGGYGDPASSRTGSTGPT